MRCEVEECPEIHEADQSERSISCIDEVCEDDHKPEQLKYEVKYA